jgi:hypothetical protein
MINLNHNPLKAFTVLNSVGCARNRNRIKLNIKYLQKICVFFSHLHVKIPIMRAYFKFLNLVFFIFYTFTMILNIIIEDAFICLTE